MPHLQIQYSGALTEQCDLGDFCDTLSKQIVSLGIYPLAGVRVRAFSADYSAIADLHSENAFVDMIFRIGEGRSDADKQRTGECIMEYAKEFFSSQLATGHFMLSLEIIEIDAKNSWKTNTVHERLKKENE